MGIFDKIRNAIFRRGGQQSAQTTGQGSGTMNRGSAAASGTSAPAAQARPATAAAPAQRPAAPAQPAAAQGAPAGQPPVDVEAVLEKLAAEQGQKLNWRSSIVDLMKLLDLDSSLEDRKELARELGYTGSTSDTATMNVWLHKQVMRKLAENGGVVPAELRD
jgi:hypothetical protein